MKNCIILHLYYQELWPVIRSYIDPLIDDNNHLYVTVCSDQSEYFEDIKSLAQNVYLLPNIGFDVAPFIYVYNKIKDMDYRTITKLHGKKSVRFPDVGQKWRTDLFNSLVGSKESYDFIMQHMKENDDSFILGPESYLLYENEESPNYKAIDNFITKWYELIPINNKKGGSFFAGTMFICSKKYLDLLFKDLDLDKVYDLFEEGGPEVSFAHGFERFIGFGVLELGGKTVII